MARKLDAISNKRLLNGTSPASGREKLRRTIDAIKAYNTGKPVKDHIAVTTYSLHKISKVDIDTVREWVISMKDDIEAYADQKGHPYHQNVGKDFSLVKWDESAYGQYEWPEHHFM